MQRPLAVKAGALCGSAGLRGSWIFVEPPIPAPLPVARALRQPWSRIQGPLKSRSAWETAPSSVGHPSRSRAACPSPARPRSCSVASEPGTVSVSGSRLSPPPTRLWQRRCPCRAAECWNAGCCKTANRHSENRPRWRRRVGMPTRPRPRRGPLHRGRPPEGMRRRATRERRTRRLVPLSQRGQPPAPAPQRCIVVGSYSLLCPQGRVGWPRGRGARPNALTPVSAAHAPPAENQRRWERPRVCC